VREANDDILALSLPDLLGQSSRFTITLDRPVKPDDDGPPEADDGVVREWKGRGELG